MIATDFMSANLFLFRFTNPEPRAIEFARRVRTNPPHILGVQEAHRDEYVELLAEPLEPVLPHVAYIKGRRGPSGALAIFSAEPFTSTRYVSLREATWSLGFRDIARARAFGAYKKGILIAE